MKPAHTFLHSLAVAAALAAGASTASAQDAKAGERKAATCIGCHGIPGYQASFPEVYRVPMIAGQTAPYIAASLAAYKKGDRKHPTMRGVAGSMSDQDMSDLAAYYAKLGGGSVKTVSVAPAAPETVKKLLDKGACASCHGADFNKPADAANPKLAGQPADYLYAALKAYKTEGNPVVGRNNPIMGAQVKQFSLAELKAMAGYIAKLPGDVHTEPLRRFR
jgi:cytochrome c553